MYEYGVFHVNFVTLPEEYTVLSVLMEDFVNPI
jgi:hypothetical protein